MTNTNKLIRQYDGCDGGKTGFTNEAGFCLASSAKRGEMRVVSVVIGASDSKTRFAAAKDLFDYAFDNFESKTYLAAGEVLPETIVVRGSKVKQVEYAPKETLSVLRKRGTEETFSVTMELSDQLSAPVEAGQSVGHAILLRDGVEIARTELVSCSDAPKYTWWEAYREEARRWNAA